MSSMPGRADDSQSVSIVLVTFNRAKWLGHTLEGILAQTHRDFELIICDDASTDGTEEICRQYASGDERINYHRNSVNLGMPGNLNQGLQMARHELVANLHDGDIYHPQLIEKWRAALLKYPSAAFVFNKYRHLNPDGSVMLVVNRFEELLTGERFLEFCFRGEHLECPVWGTVMSRRSLYERFGWFDKSYSFWADWDMWFRMAEEHDVAFVDEPLIDLPSKEVMPHLFRLNQLEGHRQMFRAFWAARRRHFADNPERLRRELTKQVIDFAKSRTGRIAAKVKRAGAG